MILPEHWETLSPEETEALLRELRAELVPVHPLGKTALHAIAQSRQTDDALFGLTDGRVVSVHLTWSSKPEPLGWPSYHIYGSFDEWAQSLAD